jgi:hypothetical protein
MARTAAGERPICVHAQQKRTKESTSFFVARRAAHHANAARSLARSLLGC